MYNVALDNYDLQSQALETIDHLLLEHKMSSRFSFNLWQVILDSWQPYLHYLSGHRQTYLFMDIFLNNFVCL